MEVLEPATTAIRIDADRQCARGAEDAAGGLCGGTLGCRVLVGRGAGFVSFGSFQMLPMQEHQCRSGLHVRFGGFRNTIVALYSTPGVERRGAHCRGHITFALGALSEEQRKVPVQPRDTHTAGPRPQPNVSFATHAGVVRSGSTVHIESWRGAPDACVCVGTSARSAGSEAADGAAPARRRAELAGGASCGALRI